MRKTMKILFLTIALILTITPAFAGTCAFFGDSITVGVRSTPSVVTATERFSYLIAQETGCTEANQAVGGEQSTQVKGRLETYLTSNDPETVTIMPFHNDADAGSGTAISLATAESNLRSMIQSSLIDGAKVILMTPPTTTHTNVNANLQNYINIIRKMPLDYKVDIIDVHAALAATAQQNPSLHSTYLMDPSHPTPAGHSAIFDVTQLPPYEGVYPTTPEPEECEEEPPVGGVDDIFTETLTSNSTGWGGGYTLRTIIPSGEITTLASGTVTKTYVTLEGTANAACYIGHQASSGDVWDMDGTPAQLTVSSSGSYTLSGTPVVAEASFVPNGDPIMVNCYVSGTGSVRARDDGPAGYKSYWKAGNDAGTANVSGYNAWGLTGTSEINNRHLILVSKIETDGF